jgi:DNA polymerase-3 subunit gamma/tau
MGQFRNLLMSLISTQDHLFDMSDRDKKEIQKQAQAAGEEKLHTILNFLINREENLKYSSSPRLILETTLIKLCHVDDFLSFSDLLKKVGALEERLASVTPQGNAIIPQQISDPANRWAGNGNSQETETPPDASIRKAKTWDEFLTFLNKKNGAMYAILKDWKVAFFEKDQLEITGEKHSFSSTYFDDKDRYDQLVNYCSEFFNGNVHVKISIAGPPPQRKESKENPSRADKPEMPPLPPPVQDVLNLFQGKIVGEDLNGV